MTAADFRDQAAMDALLLAIIGGLIIIVSLGLIAAVLVWMTTGGRR